MSEPTKNASRRSFIGKLTKTVVGASLFPTIISAADKKRNLLSLARTRQRFSANDTIQLALIGAGGMGHADTDTAITVPGVKLVAACDLYDGRLADAKKSGAPICLPRATTAKSWPGKMWMPSSLPRPIIGIKTSR